MKKCFTINPLRSVEEIRSYHVLFEKDLYQAIEIFYPYNLEQDKYNSYTNSIHELLAKFKNIEVVMHLPHGPKNSLCDLLDYKKILNIMKAGIDYSSKFNVKKFTLHLGVVDKSKPRSIYLNHINDVLIDLCKHAKKYDSDIMIENMPGIGELGYSPKEIYDIIEKTDCDNLKFILDTGHVNVSEYEIKEYVDLLKDYLIHLHLSDNSGKKDEHARLGSGNIDFKSFINLMKEINYNELYCLEILFKDVYDLINNANDLVNCDK